MIAITARFITIPSTGMRDAISTETLKFTSENSDIKLSDGATAFVVKSGANTVGNFVKWGEADANGVVYYYFMPSSKTSITTAGTDTTADLMQMVDTTNGAVTYKFEPQISIPKELGNSAGGSKVSLEIFYQVIQYELYNTDGSEMKPTVSAVSSLMNGMLDNSKYNVEY